MFKNKLSGSKEFLNTLSVGGFTQVFSMISALALNKFIAISLGPSGTTIVGQFRSLTTISTQFSTLFLKTGIIKLVAENSTNDSKNRSLILLSSKLIFISLLVICIILIVNKNHVSYFLFGDTTYSKLIIITGFSLFFFGVNEIGISILNGIREIKRLTQLRILQSFSILFFAILFGYHYNLRGVLYSLIFTQVIISIPTIIYLSKIKWFSFSILFEIIDFSQLKKLLKFAVMGLCASMTSIVILNLRTKISFELSSEEAGIWEGMLRISNAYLAIITSSISLYLLPKLSTLNKSNKIKKELLNSLKIVIPLMLGITLTIFILKDFIISIVYTDEYNKMRELFAPQLLGDFFKMIAQCFSYLVIAKAMTKFFIFTELFFALTYFILSYSLINVLGAEGAIWGYCINTILAFLFYVFKFRKLLI